MNLEMVARTIQLIIAPAVMITSCCIFGAGLLGHYSSVGERLRLTVRERVDLLRDTKSSTSSGLIVKERLDDIDFQIPNLLRHHSLMRISLVGTLVAIIFYIVDMFVIAYSVISNGTALNSAILIVFLLGVATQMIGVIYAVLDAFMSHKIFSYETRHAMSLEKSKVEHTKV